jgi:hypothetical protein
LVTTGLVGQPPEGGRHNDQPPIRWCQASWRSCAEVATKAPQIGQT